MTTQLDRILASSPSPFSDSVLPNAFRDTPDVAEIHAEARERLLASIDRCWREQVNAVQVITGDPGEGKTHLLAWLRRRSEDSWSHPGGSTIAVAPIEPVRSVDRVFHHMLHETVRHLRRALTLRLHADSALDSPLELTLWRTMLRVTRVLIDAPWVEVALAAQLRSLVQHRPERFLAAFSELLSEAWPAIGEDFVRAATRLPELSDADTEVLRVVLRFPDGALRADVLEWLGGASLADDRLDRLGTRLLLDGEDGAWRGLSTLLRVAKLGDVTLVLAFDQIEGTERLGEEVVSALLSALAELYNAPGAALIAVFCQTQIWPRMRDRAQLQARDRLDDQPALVLRALTAEQALALVRARMGRFWLGAGQAPPYESYPFDAEMVLAEARDANLRTPRAVLNHFRALLSGRPRPTEQPAAPAPSEVIRNKIKSIQEEESRKPPRVPEARADVAQGMLREGFKAVWLAGRRAAGARVEAIEPMRIRQRPAPGFRVTLERAGHRRRLYFEANNSTHGGSAAAAARRLKTVLRMGAADRVLLVRESALPVPSTAREHLAELSPQDAVLWLDDVELAPLSTFEALLNAAAAGDIAVGEQETRQTALDQLPALASLVDRVVSAVFRDADEPRDAAIADPSTLTRIRRHLRDQRAIQTLPKLSEHLQLPVDVVHAAVEALRARGMVDVVQDRSRVHVALLRPED